MQTEPKTTEDMLYLVKPHYTGHMIDHHHKLIHHVEDGQSCKLAAEVPHEHREFVNDVTHHLNSGYKMREHCFPRKEH